MVVFGVGVTNMLGFYSGWCNSGADTQLFIGVGMKLR